MATPALVERLENVASRLERVAARMGGGGGGGSDDGDSGAPHVVDYERLINTHLPKIEAAMTSLNVNGEAIANYKAAWNNSLVLVRASSACKKPGNSDLPKLVSSGQGACQSLDDYKHQSRDGPSSVMYDSALAFNWPIMRAESGFSPSAWLENQGGAAVFQMDKSKMKRNKKFEGHKEHGAQYAFCSSVQEFHKAIQEFVKENKFGGSISWNPKGKTVDEFLGGGGATVEEQKEQAAPTKAAPKKAGTGAGDARGVDLKAALAAVTDGESAAKLKKTAKRDKTQKAAGKVVAKKITNAPKAGTSGSKGNAWIAEGWEYTDVVTVDKARMTQTIMIADSKMTAFDITTKVNSVQINGCKKCRVFTNEIISQIELVRCDGVQIVVRGKAPSINVEKSEGCRISLQAGSLVPEAPRIYSSMVSALCIDLPPSDSKPDGVELAVPEQFLTIVDGKTGRATTNQVEHSG
jgi:hypothetical protein